MPRMTVYEPKVAVALLADTSASVTPQDLERESALGDSVERARGRHWTAVFLSPARTRAPASRGAAGTAGSSP